MASTAEEDLVYKELRSLYKRVKFVNEIFTSPKITTTVMIVNPELLPVLEARRAYDFLKKIDIHVKAIIINKVLELEIIPKELNVKFAEQTKSYSTNK